ncbi:FAD-dependent oxidoreductase [Candidatus Peribacteria bacterium]|nr:FAD-dependent oxidoreductase [Candidatus Peribacteria bacterium]
MPAKPLHSVVMTDDPSILILGAGPAGMAAAMELTRAGKKVTVVEKSTQVGGLAKTFSFQEPEGTYRTDIGPHRFFSKNQYLYDFIEDLLHEEWKQVPRLTRFCINGQFYLYPIRIRDVLRKIGIVRACAMMRDYAWERVRSWVAPHPLRSFEDYAVATFGRTLAEFNMLEYTEKIWGIPCADISIDWATQRIGGLSVVAAIRKALFPKRSGPKTLVDTFYYPAMGSGTIYEAIRNRIEAEGQEILLSSEPTVIRRSGNNVTGVEVTTPQGTRTFTPQAVVSSVPVPVLLGLFDPPPPPEVLEAASHLRFRSQVYLFLTVDKEQVMPDNWIYFPDKDIPFGRITEMKNFSTEMCPPGKTSLFIEFFCFEDEPLWSMSAEELSAQAIPVLERFGLLTQSEILSTRHFRLSHVYPLYDLDYLPRLHTVMQWLDGMGNFYAIGRPGRFRYTNQDHSLEMGILAAQSILTAKRLDIENVGKEKEYFERGYVRMKKE